MKFSLLVFIPLYLGYPIFQQLFNVDDSLSSLPDATVNKTTLQSWVNDEYNVAWNNLLRNMGNSSTCNDDDLYPGVIVASPSKVQPDYYYQWTRDSALTIRTLIHYLQDFIDSPDERFNEYQWLIEQYIWNNYKLQRLQTMSGDFTSGNTLGEPKFMVDNTPFNEKWGRPQNDGPPLRVSSILSFMKLNLTYKTGLNDSFIFNEIIKPDLGFVANNWEKESFDLWEEIQSLHFFTSLVQLKGLFDGIQYIKSNSLDLEDEFLDHLQSSYDNLKKFIEFYYVNSNANYVIETPNLFPHTRSGLDAAVLLGSIHSHDMNDLDVNIPFDIDNNYILNHLTYLTRDMKSRYPINHNLNQAVGLGRYPEDVYDGYGTSEGNPWFISTATAAEMLCKLVYKMISDKQDLVVTRANKEFFNMVLPIDDSDGFFIIKYKSKVFDELVDSLIKLSDSFLVVIKDHVDLRGGISEQFNKYHGFMEGARDLTWSYSSLLNALRWREKIIDFLN